MFNKAYDVLSNPKVRKNRAHEEEKLEEAQQDIHLFKNFNIQLYKWGKGEKKILLVHGWEGQAGNFADIIQPLVNIGYKVISFDGPSHGRSSSGETSVFEFSYLVEDIIKKYNITEIISHSFGGVATTYALSINPDWKVNRYLLLTTPDKFIERVNEIAKTVGITENVKNKLISKIEDQIQLDSSTLNVSDFVKNIRVDKALIIHDKDDKVIPIRVSKNVYKNWRNCEFKTVTGTGHFRILRDHSVIHEITNFFSN